MPKINFTANDTAYTKSYYLTDGVYPEWATFVKAFPCPEDPKRKLFKERQEYARKDVERAFGVLQSRWAIVRGPARRRGSIRCKAAELSVLCGAEIAVLAFSRSGKPFSFGHPSVDSVLARFSSAWPVHDAQRADGSVFRGGAR
ncbi:uncharacterized protein LOC121972344 [Zingiber officinale]|uniref:uncharacterized protein LOC121972344 n=1 Tax=Zingiber officinale TaxID=94328 RepID=UPI001C4DBE8A|nr:uncharacterized protein LOC121972344 [Zingiber officinale]